MNLNEMAALVAKEEKGKKEVSIAQIKEVIKVISVLVFENPELIEKLLASGKRNKK